MIAITIFMMSSPIVPAFELRPFSTSPRRERANAKTRLLQAIKSCAKARKGGCGLLRRKKTADLPSRGQARSELRLNFEAAAEICPNIRRSAWWRSRGLSACLDSKHYFLKNEARA
jgi:hypothetical protein